LQQLSAGTLGTGFDPAKRQRELVVDERLPDIEIT
jgi:hypothetical protein